MSDQKNNENDLLSLLPQYASEWSALLNDVDPGSTRAILNSVTEEHKSALKQALSDIDQEIRVQQANICEQTVNTPAPAATHQQDTEPLAGIASPREVNDAGSAVSVTDATVIAEPSRFEATRLGEARQNDSARHTTWPTLKAANGGEIPASIGNYDIRGVLGRGGMGIVYRARQRGLRRDVALKMILGGGHADAELLARFRAEAEAVAQLQHPNIVQIYEIGDQDGLPYFSLEFVEGQTLDEFRDDKPVAERTAGKLIETIAHAMHFAHGAGIIHRDLKPANILLTTDGVPKVTDFGLVKRLEGDDVDSQTQAGAIMGTPRYMAPEQAWGRSDIGPAADIWALGSMLYALLTGRPAFSGATTLDTLVLLKESQPVAPRDLVPNLSIDIETICLKCLQKDPERRYETAEKLAEDLRRYLDGVPILARPVSRTERTVRWCRRNPVIAGLSAAFVAALIIGTATSTAFGIRANNSAIAEADARGDAEEKRLLAEKNEQKAKAAERLAMKNEEQALNQRTVALGAFNTAVEWAGTDLRNVPGTEKFKKRLFGAAVQGLNRLSEIAGNDRRDLAIARGYAKAGEGMLEVGQAGQAKAQFDESHEILERLAAAESETDEVIHFLRLGRSFRNIGRAEMALNGPNAGIRWHSRAVAIREKALALHDDPLFVKQELAESYGDLGRAYLEAGKANEASETLAIGAGYRDEWLAKAPENEQAIRQQAGLRRDIGNVKLGLADVPSAIVHLRKAVELMAPYAVRETASSRDHLTIGQFRANLADALLFNRQNETAFLEYEAALTSVERVRVKNPKHVPSMNFQASALYGLAVVESRLQKNTAAQHLTECVELRRKIVATAPSNNQFQRSLMIALARSGETDDALKIAEQQRSEFGEDGGVLFHVACAYSLASLASLVPDGEKHATIAIATLQAAIQHGHEGLALMAVDPDLEPLHDREDFRKLITDQKVPDSEEVARRG